MPRTSTTWRDAADVAGSGERYAVALATAHYLEALTRKALDDPGSLSVATGTLRS